MIILASVQTLAVSVDSSHGHEILWLQLAGTLFLWTNWTASVFHVMFHVIDFLYYLKGFDEVDSFSEELEDWQFEVP